MPRFGFEALHVFVLFSFAVAQPLYDLLGRPVAMLIDGRKPAGQHEAVFDARAMTSGVYLYRLQAGPQVKTKLMTLLK